MWNTVLTRAEIDASHALTAKLDPAFAARDRAWYASRTANQLSALASGAWNCNDSTTYQMARSYLCTAQLVAN